MMHEETNGIPLMYLHLKNIWKLIYLLLQTRLLIANSHPTQVFAFIVDKPVKREIFAADFIDRMVHYLRIGKINNLFKKQYIYVSYSYRTGKDTHFGNH